MLCGRSAVDQAVLTGESMPVDKGEGDPVYTGTFNQFGRLEVRAEKLGAEPRRWARSSELLADVGSGSIAARADGRPLRPPVPARRAGRRGGRVPGDQRARALAMGLR